MAWQVERTLARHCLSFQLGQRSQQFCMTCQVLRVLNLALKRRSMPADYKGARTFGLLRSELCRAIAAEDRALQLLVLAGLRAQPCSDVSCEVLGLKPSCWFFLGFSFYGNKLKQFNS